MFTNIKIKNFRVLKDLEVNNLSRVNLFFGKNNCGKTTLLESVFLLCGMNNPELYKRCNLFRSYKHIKDLSFFFYDLNKEKEIVFESKGTLPEYNRISKAVFSEKTSRKVIKNTDEDTISINNFIPNTELDIFSSIIGEDEISSRILLKQLKVAESLELSIPTFYKEKIYCNFLSSQALIETLPNMVTKVVQNKNEKIIIKALKLIDPRIKDFIFINNEVMVDVGLTQRIPINMLGDGVRKFFTLVLAIHDSKNGVLLIDEIDNGLHYSVMKQLWNIVLNLSKEFNVQLFITTHNIDSLKGLNSVLSEKIDNSEVVSLYTLLNDNNENKVLYYDAKSFSTIIEQENEVR